MMKSVKNKWINPENQNSKEKNRAIKMIKINRGMHNSNNNINNSLKIYNWNSKVMMEFITISFKMEELYRIEFWEDKLPKSMDMKNNWRS